ncbi:hypothetical protein GW17_00047686 [Ensete ventricosum]|nr:hypothetical protein GW17_00047686 [Ensete ventricosum]
MGVELVYLIPLHHKRCTLNSEYSTRILKQRRNELDIVLTVALQGQVKLRRQVKKQSKKDLNIADLEAYTVTSEEAPNVKFEAFEICMEEKIRTIFVELGMGRC